tara:strand:+ start:39 stop:332 length:294 start_codon:yes stop_codon:yes gene_type:complete
MKRFSKILNREISDEEVFQVENYIITRYYTDLSPRDTCIEHTLTIRFKFDFSDFDAIGKIVYMEEVAQSHWNSKEAGILNEDNYFFKEVPSSILHLV